MVKKTWLIYLSKNKCNGHVGFIMGMDIWIYGKKLFARKKNAKISFANRILKIVPKCRTKICEWVLFNDHAKLRSSNLK